MPTKATRGVLRPVDGHPSGGPTDAPSHARTGHPPGHPFDAVPAPAGPPADSASDEALLAGYGEGHPEPARAFVRRFQKRVYGLALKLAGDRAFAEDIAQDALLRAWRHASSFDPAKGSVATWVLTITRNTALDALRRHRPESLHPNAEAFLQMVALDPLPADAVVFEEQMDSVRAALARLPTGQRRAVVLASLFGLTAREIAEAEELPLGTAKTRIRAGLLRLRADLNLQSGLPSQQADDHADSVRSCPAE
jgi:RNA polymerase sigma factor (sigma-70 family)